MMFNLGICAWYSGLVGKGTATSVGKLGAEIAGGFFLFFFFFFFFYFLWF
jgi:hypothetical protein